MDKCPPPPLLPFPTFLGGGVGAGGARTNALLPLPTFLGGGVGAGGARTNAPPPSPNISGGWHSPTTTELFFYNEFITSYMYV